MSHTLIRTKDTFDVAHAAITKAVDLISLTFGPAGNKVLINTDVAKRVVDDGVDIARRLQLPDLEEDAIWEVARNVAIRTNDRQGDGTTGSLIILRAILDEVKKIPLNFRNYRELADGLTAASKEVIEALRAASLKVSKKDDLEKVARISFDDPVIAKMLSEAWHELGKDGLMAVAKSGTMETTVEVTEGIRLPSGYTQGWMVTNPERMEAIAEKPLIFLTDYKITQNDDLVRILNAVMKAHRDPLVRPAIVIISDGVEQEALATLAINHFKIKNPDTGQPGPLNTIAINLTGTEEEKEIFLEDLALMTGATFFSKRKGLRPDDSLTADSFGRCERVVARADSSVIISPQGDKEAVKVGIDALLDAIKNAASAKEKDDLKTRLARLKNKMAVVKVGANTDQEQRALQFKIEDAVHAIQSALISGVVPGGGQALRTVKNSSPLLTAALQAPMAQLLKNGGLSPEVPEIGEGEAFNVRTGTVGKFMDVGVCDPVDVLIAAVESAVSIASLLLTTPGMVVQVPEEGEDKPRFTL